MLVIGGGPGGLKAAAVAAERGHRVTLVEAGRRVGGQVLLAQELPERAEIGGAVDNLLAEARRSGVEIVTGVRADRRVRARARARRRRRRDGRGPLPAADRGDGLAGDPPDVGRDPRGRGPRRPRRRRGLPLGLDRPRRRDAAGDARPPGDARGRRDDGRAAGPAVHPGHDDGDRTARPRGHPADDAPVRRGLERGVPAGRPDRRSGRGRRRRGARARPGPDPRRLAARRARGGGRGRRAVRGPRGRGRALAADDRGGRARGAARGHRDLTTAAGPAARLAPTHRP